MTDTKTEPTIATLSLQGTIDNYAESEFTDQDTGQVVTTRTLQFRTKLRNGKLDYIDLKLPPEIDHKQFKVGETWAIPCLISSYQNKLYYRANPIMEPQKLS